MEESIEERTSIIYFLHVIVRWRKLIAGIVLMSSLTALLISLILPHSYTARATILPPEQQSSTINFSAFLSQNTGLPIGNLGLPGLSSTSDLFVEILKSRSIAVRLIEKFNLVEFYNAHNLNDSINKLRDATRLHTDKTGLISIEVEAPDPQLAADLANTYLAELDRFNRDNNTTSAKNTRIFVETRIEETRDALNKALVALQQFQERYQLVSLNDQARVAVEAAAELESNLRLLELQLAVLRKTLHATHPSVIQMQLQAEELRKQVNRLRFGDGQSDTLSRIMGRDIDIADVKISFSQMPALQLKLGQLMMEVKVQQTVFEFLRQQYEHAKIQEVRDTPTVRQLDTAVPPDVRSRPRRKLIVIMTGAISLFAGVIVAFLVEYRETHPDDAQKISQIADMLRGDLLQVKRLFRR